MNKASRLRLPKLGALAGLATVSLMGACTYDFDQFEGLGPPVVDDAGQSGRGGSGGTEAGRDASADGSTGRGGTANTGGAGSGGSGGGGGAGGTTGSGGAGATGGLGGSGGSSGSGGSAGSSGKSGASGSAGSAGSSGTGGNTADASTDGSGGTGGATGGSGGSGDGTGGTTGGSGGATGGSGGTTGGSGGTTGGSGGATGGTGGSGGSPPADASDVTRPSDVQPDNRVVDTAVDARFDCAAVSGTVYQGHCYYARSVAVDWNTASTTTCEAPAYLATITTAGEQAVVEALLPNQDRWLGLRRPTNSPKAESSFYWVTNEPLSFRAWDVYSDADKEPNYTGECVRMRFTSMWADVACTEALAAICEHD